MLAAGVSKPAAAPVSPLSPFRFLKSKLKFFAVLAPLGVTVTEGVPTALLTVAALLVKILSAIYRVPFQNLVGDEGFYIYQQVYPFIAVFVGGLMAAIFLPYFSLLTALMNS